MAAFKQRQPRRLRARARREAHQRPRAGGDPRRHARPHHRPARGEVASKTLAQVRGLPHGRARQPAPSRARSRRASASPRWPRCSRSPAREGAFVNMEIKNQPTDPDFDAGSGFADTVMAAVRASGFPRSRLIVQSFWPPNLTAAKARLPGVADLVPHPRAGQRRRPGVRAGERAPVGLARLAGHRRASWPTRTARGLKVVPYTLNAAAEFRAARDAGVDALITDDPDAGGAHARASRARQLAPEALEAGGAHPRAALRQRHRPPARASASGWRPPTAAAAWRAAAAVPAQHQRRHALAGGARARPARPRSSSAAGRGQTYQFRLRARDRLGNFSPYVYARTSVPLDDRSRRLRFRGGWARARGAQGLRRDAAAGAASRRLDGAAVPRHARGAGGAAVARRRRC